MESLFEQMGGTYHQEGDLLVPNLVLSDTTDYHVGKYGRMRHRYLKEHRRVLFNIMLTNETLAKHVADIDAACRERLEVLIPAMAKQEGATEQLKATDQMEWVRRMNSIKNRAEEIVLQELVYD